MNAKSLSLVAIMVVVLAGAGTAWGYTIENELALDRVSQIVNLKGVSTNGEINFSAILRVKPDGTEVPFIIPAGRVLVITKFYFDFKTTSSQLYVNVRFDPFLSPAANGSPITNGNSSGSQIFGSGCPVGRPSASSPTYVARAVVPGVGTTIPGDLTVHITGFLLNPHAAVAPINFLLLLQ
jgi:hypothetical protein